MIGIWELGIFSIAFLVSIGGFVVALVALVDAARRPVGQWEAAQQQQTLWIVLCAVGLVVWPLGLVVGLVYLAVIRRQLQTVRG